MRLSIGSAGDLLAGLEHAELKVVLAVHKAIRANPAGALAYGSVDGRDVVDALIARAAHGTGLLALTALATLAQFEDTRVREFFLDQLRRARGRSLELAVGYLSTCDLERATLFEPLLADDTRARARGAARLLGAPHPDDPPRVLLRLALLDPESPLPAPGDLWRGELTGVLAAEAAAALRSQGRPAFDWLLGVPDFPRAAMLEWGVRHWPLECLALVRAELPSALAWRCLDLAPLLREALVPELTALAASPDEAVRGEALRRLPTADWAAHYERETSLRALCLQRWGREAPLSVLLACLHEDDWRLRAAASEELVARGGPPEALQPLATHPSLGVRAAAVQILASLEQTGWVEEALLTP